MSSIALSGNASGAGVLTIAAPNTASNYTLTLPTQTGTLTAGGPAFSAYANAGTSLTNNAFTKVLFQLEEFDTNSNFASSTFTPTVAGYYQINAVVGSGGFGANQSNINIYKNGTKYKTSSNQTVNNLYSLSISCLVYCNGSTDYIEIYVFQNSGAAITSQNNSTDSWFTGCMLRGA